MELLALILIFLIIYILFSGLDWFDYWLLTHKDPEDEEIKRMIEDEEDKIFLTCVMMTTFLTISVRL